MAPHEQPEIDFFAHYADVLQALNRHHLEYLVGGGFGLCCYVSHWRPTKDLDLFMRPTTVETALDVLGKAGFDVELTDARWLAKARRGGSLTDIIFRSYNGLFPVDDRWFANARAARICGVPVKIVGPEEMLVSKSFVAARDRFDGSDISWLMRSYGRDLDWPRIEEMFGEEHWPVLLWQLVHFLYVFPDKRDQVPRELVQRLMRRFETEILHGRAGDDPWFGPMLDPVNYQRDVARRSCSCEQPALHVMEEEDLPPLTLANK